jgi:hypothetical protein
MNLATVHRGGEKAGRESCQFKYFWRQNYSSFRARKCKNLKNPPVKKISIRLYDVKKRR